LPTVPFSFHHISSANHERVLIFLTDHSHEDTGDLFIGPGFCSPLNDVSGWHYHLDGR
jgi:hypothetical protein